MKILVQTLAVIIALVLLFGCSNDETPVETDPPQGTNSTTWDEAGGYWVTTIDASSYEDFSYYSFATKDIVTGVSKAASGAVNEWDLAFRRTEVITNSGVSGDGDVQGADLFGLGLVDTLGFNNVVASILSSIGAEDWHSDDHDLLIDNYFNFNLQTFELDLTNYVYDMKDAEGNFFKLQITDIFGGGAPPSMGTIVLKYVYQPNGSSDLSGTTVIDSVDGSSGLFYYDFSAGTTTNPSDPMTSLDWDLKFSHYDVFMNSGLFGSGVTSGNPIYLITDQIDSTDFDGYTTAAEDPQAYFKDKLRSIFAKYDEWYRYWPQQGHLITSAKRTYLLQADGKFYKLFFVGFYGSTGVSGNYIFNWQELN